MNWRKLPNYTILIGHPVGPDDTWALELFQSLALGSNLRKYKFSVPNDLFQSHKHNVFKMVFFKAAYNHQVLWLLWCIQTVN